MNYRLLIAKYWWIAQLLLVLFCLVLYTTDVILGDGDGILAKFNINPLTLFLVGELVLILLKGLFSTRNWINNLSLSLLFLLLGLMGFNFLMGKLPAFKTITVNRITPLEGGFPCTSYDTVFFKNFRPNTRFLYSNHPKDGGQQIPVNINKQGMRGTSYLDKNQQKKRTLLIGDSFIQALQVAEEHTVGQQLDLLLADSIQILQHGFSSWAPLLEFNWLLRKGIQLEPDEVILFLFNNDFFPGKNTADEFYSRFTNFDQNGYPSSFSFEKASIPPRNMWTHLKSRWQNIHLIKWLSLSHRLNVANNILPSEELEEHISSSALKFEANYSEKNFHNDPLIAYNWNLLSVFRDTSIWNETTRKRVDLSLSYISKMHEFLEQQSIAFKVVLIPYAFQFKDENIFNKTANHFGDFRLPNTGLNQQINSFCQERNIPFLNLYIPFLNYKNQHPGEHLYFNVDGHWNENGHRVAAEVIAEWKKNLEKDD